MSFASFALYVFFSPNMWFSFRFLATLFVGTIRHMWTWKLSHFLSSWLFIVTTFIDFASSVYVLISNALWKHAALFLTHAHFFCYICNISHMHFTACLLTMCLIVVYIFFRYIWMVFAWLWTRCGCVCVKLNFLICIRVISIIWAVRNWDVDLQIGLIELFPIS